MPGSARRIFRASGASAITLSGRKATATIDLPKLVETSGTRAALALYPGLFETYSGVSTATFNSAFFAPLNWTVAGPAASLKRTLLRIPGQVFTPL